MARRRLYWLTVLILQNVSAMSASAQKGGQAAAQDNPQAGQASQSQSGAGQGLQGFSFAPEEWPQLGLPDVKSPIRTVGGRTVVCYKLTKANSATQPFILQRINLPSEVVGTGFDRPCGEKGKGETDTLGRKLCVTNPQADNHWNSCSPLDETHAILMGQELVIGIDVSDLSDSGVNINQLKLLNVNVTAQQSSPLNPSPIRPSFPGTAAGGATSSTGSAGEASQAGEKGGWWTALPTRPAAWDGQRTWKACQYYEKDTVVANSTRTRFYRATKSFNSGPVLLDPFPREQRPDRIQDGSVIWQEMNAPANTIDIPEWQPGKPYPRLSIVKIIRGGAGPNRTAAVQRLFLSWETQSFANVVAQFAPKDFAAGSGVKKALEATQASGAPVQRVVDVREITTSSVIVKKADAVPASNSPADSCDRPASSEEPKETWQYYWAVKGGTSGPVPSDPFSIALIPRAIYIPWPYQLPGDIIPSFTVNLVYTPPVPGAPWQGDTFYPAGSVVTSASNSGHYYTALTGGFSDAEPKEPAFPVNPPPTVHDGGLVWLDSGASAPSVSPQAGGQSPSGGAGGGQGGGAAGGGKPQQWLAKSHYMLGDIILNPYNGHYYTMVGSTGGTSGPGTPQPAQGGNTRQQAKDPFPQLLSSTTIQDGELLLVHTATATRLQPWARQGRHSIGDYLNINGFSYKVIGSTATTATTSSSFPRNPGDRVRDGEVFWQAQEGPVPAYTDPWKASTPYSFGQAVSHQDEASKIVTLYVMVGAAAGISGKNAPITPAPPGGPTTVSDGDLLWMATAVQADPTACLNLPKWRPSLPYQLNDLVYSSDCQQYQMIRYTAGTSGASPLSPFPMVVIDVAGGATSPPNPNTVNDGTIVWAVTEKSNGATPWQAQHGYSQTAIVYAVDDPNQSDPQKRQYWSALNTGTSGLLPAQPRFPVFEPQTVVEPETVVRVNNTFWKDSGVIRPVGVPPGDLNWSSHPSTPYKPGDVVFIPGAGNGRYYTALPDAPLPPGNPQNSQSFPPASSNLPVTWQDTGTTAPAAVASGQPADQTVGLLNAPLPQTHSLSYFNIASGFVVSFTRPLTLGYVWSNNVKNLPTGFVPATNGPTSMNLAVDPTTGCTISTMKNANGTTPVYYCPQKTGHGSYPVDPVLGLTVYYPPVDAEVPFRWNNPRNWIPGASVAFSLANPTNNFYLGGSNEFLIRNVQVFYGLAFLKVPVELGTPTSQPVWGGVGTAPSVSTKQGFQKGFFTGFTFNLSGFIQSLGFGGSKASGQ
jgi:hypothetical protein